MEELSHHTIHKPKLNRYVSKQTVPNSCNEQKVTVKQIPGSIKYYVVTCICIGYTVLVVTVNLQNCWFYNYLCYKHKALTLN